MPALLTRMSSRPWRSTIGAGQLLERRAIGHVDADRLGRPPRRGDLRHRRRGVVAARRGDDVAPCRANCSAIARPIPRDAPVTSATFPVRLKHRKQRLDRGQIVGLSESTRVASRWIRRTMPLSTVPGPTSTYVVTPSDARRRRHLPSAPATTPARSAPRSRRARSASAAASTFATIGTRGSCTSQRAQFRREPDLRRLHQRAMERRADRQRHHAPRAERLRALAGALDGVARTRDHDLPAAVQIRRADDLALRRLVSTPVATVAASRPRIAAIAPVPTGTASCM